MKSVDFTVQRLLSTSPDPNAKLRCDGSGIRCPVDDHVTGSDVITAAGDEGGPAAGAPSDEYDDDSPAAAAAQLNSDERRVDSLPVDPSLYLDYARQFLWQLTAAYRPGLHLIVLCIL